jgi:hypothetical protein
MIKPRERPTNHRGRHVVRKVSVGTTAGAAAVLICYIIELLINLVATLPQPYTVPGQIGAALGVLLNTGISIYLPDEMESP